jgi:uncharacterized protein
MPPEPISEVEEVQHRRHSRDHTCWSALATIGWGILIAAAIMVSEIVSVVAYLIVTRSVGHSRVASNLADIRYDGLLLSINTFVGAAVSLGLTMIIVKLKAGSGIRDYLGLVLPTRRQFFGWWATLIVLLLTTDFVFYMLGEPIVPDVMAKTYASMRSPWTLWLALLMGAPLSEEIFFRGFLMPGLSRSTLRWIGAAILTSLGWAAIHLQYDLYGMAAIFVLGLLLATARAKTGSTILTMFLHSFTNLGATVEVLMHLHGYAF